MRTQGGLTRLQANGIPHVVLSNLVQQGAAFLAVILIAKILGPSDFAFIRIALAYVAVAAVVAGGGFTAPVLRYCADAFFAIDAKKRVLGVALRRVFLFSSLTLVLLLGAIVARYEAGNEFVIFISYALQLPGLAVAALLLVYLQAIQQFRVLAFSQIFIRLASLVVTTLAAYLSGLSGFLLASLLMAYFVCVPLWFFVRPVLVRLQQASVPEDFNRLAFYSLVGTLITTIGQYADLIILDLTGTLKEDIAVYSLAVIFFFAASALIGAVQSVATPGFTALIKDPEQFRKKLYRWTAIMSAVGVPVAVFSIAVAYGVEHWFLGEQYSGLTGLLILLMIKFCLWCSYAIGGAALVGIGAIKQGMWIAVITTSVSIGLGYVLCLHFGVWGAAWTQVAVSIVSVVVIWRVILQQVAMLRPL